jgi:hypothetical protein
MKIRESATRPIRVDSLFLSITSMILQIVPTSSATKRRRRNEKECIHLVAWVSRWFDFRWTNNFLRARGGAKQDYLVVKKNRTYIIEIDYNHCFFIYFYVGVTANKTIYTHLSMLTACLFVILGNMSCLYNIRVRSRCLANSLSSGGARNYGHGGPVQRNYGQGGRCKEFQS